MNIWLVVVAIAIASIALAVAALKDLENKTQLSQTKKKLFKGRVVFQDSSSRK